MKFCGSIHACMHACVSLAMWGQGCQHSCHNIQYFRKFCGSMHACMRKLSYVCLTAGSLERTSVYAPSIQTACSSKLSGRQVVTIPIQTGYNTHSNCLFVSKLSGRQVVTLPSLPMLPRLFFPFLQLNIPRPLYTFICIHKGFKRTDF